MTTPNDDERPLSYGDLRRFWQAHPQKPEETPPPFDRRRTLELPISSSTKIQFTPFQVWMAVGVIISGVAAAYTTFYGITARIDQQKNDQTGNFYEIKAQLTEINYLLKGNVTREEFRNYCDALRDTNPNLHVPAPAFH